MFDFNMQRRISSPAFMHCACRTMVFTASPDTIRWSVYDEPVSATYGGEPTSSWRSLESTQHAASGG